MKSQARSRVGRRAPLLIISLHGASWSGLSSFIDAGAMPHFSALRQAGTSGNLTGVLPTFVQPNWASFWTGETPNRHIFFGFASPAESGVVRSPVDWRDFDRPAWIELAAAHGLRTVSFDAPLAYPRRGAEGCFIRCRQDGTFLADPPQFAPETRYGPLQPGPVDARRFFPDGGFCCRSDVRDFVDKCIANLEQTNELLLNVLHKQSWDVVLAHFATVDAIQHALWHGIDRSDPGFDDAVLAEAAPFFSALDAALGRVLGTLHPQTVLLFSGHGFTACRGVLNLSRSLCERGLLEPLSQPHPMYWNAVAGAAKRRLRIYLDHKAIYVPKEGAHVERLVDRLATALEAIDDPQTGRRVLRKVWRTEEIYGPLAVPEWSVLILELAEGYSVRNGDLDRPELWPCTPNRDYLVGTHSQTGVWVFASPGASRPLKADASILDLAPTILSYLKVPTPRHMLGRDLSALCAK